MKHEAGEVGKGSLMQKPADLCKVAGAVSKCSQAGREGGRVTGFVFSRDHSEYKGWNDLRGTRGEGGYK